MKIGRQCRRWIQWFSDLLDNFTLSSKLIQCINQSPKQMNLPLHLITKLYGWYIYILDIHALFQPVFQAFL
jgi:hypothetical protein